MRRLALIAPLVLAACGSATTMQLYPTAGPLAVVERPEVIEAKAANGEKGTSGELTFRITDGPKCKGTWSSVAPKVVSRERGLNFKLTSLPGASVGRTTETVGGVNSGEIFAICRDGTRVQGSFVIGSGTTSGTGEATDTLGNTYKILF